MPQGDTVQIPTRYTDWGIADNGGLSCGVCCSVLDDEDLLKYFRFMKFRIPLDVITDGPSGAGGDWVIPADTELKVFTKGIGEDGAVAGFVANDGDGITLDETQTDAYDGGALVPRNCAFKAYGLAVIVVAAPFILADSDNAPVYNAAAEDVYGTVLAQVIENNVVGTLDTTFSKCEYRLGLIREWPADQATSGDQYNVTSGLSGVVEKFTVVVCFTDRDANRRPSIKFQTKHRIIINQDGTAPVAIFGNTDGEETPAEKLFVECEAKLFGHRVALSQYCGPNGQQATAPAPGMMS